MRDNYKLISNKVDKLINKNYNSNNHNNEDFESNERIEQTTKAEPIYCKSKYFNGFCGSSSLALGIQIHQLIAD